MKVLEHKYFYVYGSDGYVLVAKVLTEKGEIKYLTQWGAYIEDGYLHPSTYSMRFYSSFEEAEEAGRKM